MTLIPKRFAERENTTGRQLSSVLSKQEYKADVPIRREPDSNTTESYHSAQIVPAGYNSEAILEFDRG
jgi:hypothetical protein